MPSNATPQAAGATVPVDAVAATLPDPEDRTGRPAVFSFGAFVERVRRFHGHAAPGVCIGGFMVDEARRRLAPDVLFDAVCESEKCLPDAVQLLTPCTVGNGWLRIFDCGIFALALYDKRTGHGWRVHVNADALDPFPAIKAWFLKEQPKAAQDGARLAAEIARAGRDILTVAPVTVRPDLLRRKRGGAIVRCPLCGAAYPAGFGAICRSCQGGSPYAVAPQPAVSLASPSGSAWDKSA